MNGYEAKYSYSYVGVSQVSQAGILRSICNRRCYKLSGNMIEIMQSNCNGLLRPNFIQRLVGLKYYCSRAQKGAQCGMQNKLGAHERSDSVSACTSCAAGQEASQPLPTQADVELTSQWQTGNAAALVAAPILLASLFSPGGAAQAATHAEPANALSVPTW